MRPYATLAPVLLLVAAALAVRSAPSATPLLLGVPPADRTIGGALAPVPDPCSGGQAFEAQPQQFGYRLERPFTAVPGTRLEWWWRKPAGKLVVIQLCLTNPDTGAKRYYGYGAGSLAEQPSGDPTVETWVGDEPPRGWVHVVRDLGADVQVTLGWQRAQVSEVYLSPWDNEPARYAGLAVSGAAQGTANGPAGPTTRELSAIASGRYATPPLKPVGRPRELKFDTSFEEVAPGRNSAANEWSAFGADMPNMMNCMGRDMRVRYPACDLVFRLADADGEVSPDSLASFRLELVDGRLPGIQARWTHDGLAYRVGVVSVPMDTRRAYDLYRVQVTNRSATPRRPRLTAGIDGPPDLALRHGVVRGLGQVPLIVATGLQASPIRHRDWGVCDKRAKSYRCGDGPGATEPAVSSTRIGMDGLPVRYRFRAEPGRSYTVATVASPHISGLLGKVRNRGDLVLSYQVEGAPSHLVAWADYIGKKAQPIAELFRGARDVDGDGFINVVAGCAPGSRVRHSRLSVIYVLPDEAQVTSLEDLYAGRLNDRCLMHLDVGATPECDWQNQYYDTSDVGCSRLDLGLSGTIAPGASRTAWIKVPPIHRRQPTSMGSVSHAFLQVLPGEQAPPFGPDEVGALAARNPKADWNSVQRYWERFSAGMAAIHTPDPVLADMFRSRLATRAIHDVQISGPVWFNACSPWFYYDFAYRDQAYCVYAYDLAGLHDRARRLLDVYCMDVDRVPKGPTAFAETPLQLGMLPNGLWLTRAGQYDSQGQNIWCMVEHYRLSGDLAWLKRTAYPYVRRGAMWIVDARHRHMKEVGRPADPRYGLLPPGAMEVATVTRGMHHYYMNAWAVLGLDEAADAARSAGKPADAALFLAEARHMRQCLHRSFAATFRRSGLYTGQLWYGVESQGDGMFGPWGHTPLVWPTRSMDPHDPMLDGTYAAMERMSHSDGGGVYSDAPGSCWPYIGIDWAISQILRGEPDKTVDAFCAYTDTAGGTFSWGEGYENARNLAAGDQPHMWADAQWVNLYRHLFALEDGTTLHLLPATLRRWQATSRPVRIDRLPTAFGDLRLTGRASRGQLRIEFELAPKGDQSRRRLDRILLSARLPGGRAIAWATVNGRPAPFTRDQVVISRPVRGRTITVRVGMEP